MQRYYLLFFWTMTIRLYRNGRKYGRRRRQIEQTWLKPPSRPPDPENTPKDPHEHDISNTKRYQSRSEHDELEHIIARQMLILSHSTSIFKAGRRTPIPNDTLFDKLQTDRYQYYKYRY